MQGHKQALGYNHTWSVVAHEGYDGTVHAMLAYLPWALWLEIDDEGANICGKKDNIDTLSKTKRPLKNVINALTGHELYTIINIIRQSMEYT